MLTSSDLTGIPGGKLGYGGNIMIGRQKNGLSYLRLEGGYREGGAGSFKNCTEIGFKHPGAGEGPPRLQHAFKRLFFRSATRDFIAYFGS